MLPAVLVIEPDEGVRDEICDALRPLSCVVTTAASFDEGRELLVRLEPMLLVAPVQLQEYNAIHLALVARVASPQTHVIIRGYADTSLAREAADAGATYLVDPGPSDVAAAVRSALGGSTRRWPRAAVNAEARVESHQVRVIDVSYGGFRIEAAAATPIDRHEPMALALGGLRVRARPIWTRATDDADSGETLWVGAAVEDEGDREWRSLVDAALEGSGAGR
jgi:DNA-binding NarL/FixJ family response regulator